MSNQISVQCASLLDPAFTELDPCNAYDGGTAAAGISQEVEGLLSQLRVLQLNQESWDIASVLFSQLATCVHFCMACAASACWSCAQDQLETSNSMSDALT